MSRDNVRQLFGPSEPVQLLEEVLAIAKGKDVDGIAVAFTTTDGDIATAHVGRNYAEVIGAMEVLKHRMIVEKVREDGGQG